MKFSITDVGAWLNNRRERIVVSSDRDQCGAISPSGILAGIASVRGKAAI
jgi:hypothetical protein